MPDPDFPRGDALKEHNLIVTLEDEEQARRVVDSLSSAGLSADITLNSHEDQRAALRGDMRDELDATVIGPGNVGPFTKGMSKGVVKWTTICGIVGIAAGILLALLVWRSGLGVAVMAAIGGTAGATLGFSTGGFLGPRAEQEGRPDSQARPTVGVHADTMDEIRKAQQVLEGQRVIRLDHVDATGRPIGTAAKDSRPLRGETPT
ncbi:MAG TPA: hypothetical protein VM573_10495 [Actinomycetota bacterium]|nr:hypothetical protein [Actinomycetota bacterium]